MCYDHTITNTRSAPLALTTGSWVQGGSGPAGGRRCGLRPTTGPSTHFLRGYSTYIRRNHWACTRAVSAASALLRLRLFGPCSSSLALGAALARCSILFFILVFGRGHLVIAATTSH